MQDKRYKKTLDEFIKQVKNQAQQKTKEERKEQRTKLTLGGWLNVKVKNCIGQLNQHRVEVDCKS